MSEPARTSFLASMSLARLVLGLCPRGLGAEGRCPDLRHRCYEHSDEFQGYPHTDEVGVLCPTKSTTVDMTS